MNIAIVTGASSGMGKEFVLQLDKAFKKLDEIWVIARRKERLQDLAAQIKTKLVILDYDLTKESDIKEFACLLKEQNPSIRMLINSAGYGIIGNFEEGDYQDEIGMIELNCVALTAVTHHCLAYMSKGSRIIQLASSASFLPQPKFAVYAATKAYVLSLSQALRIELRDRKISVTAVCPGPVATEFFPLAEKKDKMASYKMLVMADPKKVVSAALIAATKRKELSVYGIPMKLLMILTKIAPRFVLLDIMDMMQ